MVATPSKTAWKPRTPHGGSDKMLRELAVPGAWEITPKVDTDQRGLFFEWFTQEQFSNFAGHEFDLRQANCSVSEAGVLRGLHFAQLPPGQAKYVTCLSGAVFDVVVDVRVGSPTYGQWDAVILDGQQRRSVYLAEGLAHAFLALHDDSTVMYLCSSPYNPQREHTILATDPAIGIDWPSMPTTPQMSPRDRDAPTLQQSRDAGLLPTWEAAEAYLGGTDRS